MSKVLVLKIQYSGRVLTNLVSCPTILLNNGVKNTRKDVITVRDTAR